MPFLDFSSDFAFARTDATQANLGTATTLGYRVRLDGAALLSGTAAGSEVLRVALGATLRLALYVARTGGNVVVVLAGPGGTNPLIQLFIADGLFTASAFYVIRAWAGPGGCAVHVYDAAGTEMGSDTAAGVTVSNNGAANGLVTLGRVGTTTVVGLIDGAAIYGAVPPAGVTTPANTDSGILAYYPLEEGTGTSSANDVAGGVDLTVFHASALWDAADSEWEATGGGGGALTAGVATLGTVTSGEVQASATDATGGTAPYTYQWQRSPRGTATWADVTGQTSRTLSDTTVSPETDYDYRLEYTDDAAAVVHSNVIEADVPAVGTTAVSRSAAVSYHVRSVVARSAAATWDVDVPAVRGNATLAAGGSVVEGATVRVFDQTTDTYLGETLSEADGSWRFNTAMADYQHLYHAFIEFEDGGIQYNAPSQPFLTPV